MSKFKKVFIISSIVILVAFFVLLPFIIKVKNTCLSQYGACPPEIESGLINKKQTSLFETKNKIKTFLKNQFMVSAFSTQFKLPNTLVVNIIIKKPSFVLKNDSNQKILVDENGKILALTNEAFLPEVLVVGNLKKVGDNVDPDQLFALNLIAGVNEMYQVKMGQIQDNSLVVELPTGIKVIFPLSGDSQVLLGALRLVYSKIQSGDQGVRYSQIDLRFKNPVPKII